MHRRPLIAGNWKMHKTIAAARTLAAELRNRLEPSLEVEVAVAPSFTALAAVAEAVAGGAIRVGAQNMYHAAEGAYTGEISPVMLTDAGASFVILGHSERRALFGERDETVALKVRAALAHDLTPYVCCGESRREREGGQTERVVERQLGAVLGGLPRDEIARLVVAYEPVWAIGTGLTATPAQAQEVHARIRALLRDAGGAIAAERVRILYGGSVKPSNAAALLAEPDVDGALVGGASLDADAFVAIVRAAAGER